RCADGCSGERQRPELHCNLLVREHVRRLGATRIADRANADVIFDNEPVIGRLSGTVPWVPDVGIEIRLLGPLEVSDHGRVIEVKAGRQRALVALLALHVGETVSTDKLLDELWDGRPPPTALSALRNLVSQARRVIDPEQTGLLATRAPGYSLDIPPDAIDAHRFKRLAAEGHAALETSPARASEVLVDALGLWRGEALAEFAFERFAQPEISRLDEIRSAALSDRIDADLALGRHADLVPELRTLVERYPLDEHHRRQQMLALYRCGRQADALDTYRALRTHLNDELGLEPSTETRQLEQAILSQDTALGPVARLPLAPLRKRRRWTAAVVGVIALASVGAVAVLTGKSSTPTIVPDSLVKIDPRTNTIVDVISLGQRPGPLAVVGPYVFTSSARDNTLSRIDRESGDVVTKGGFTRPRGVAADGPTLVWVVNEGRHEVLQLDTTTLEPVARIVVPSSGLGYVTTGADTLWLTESPPAAVSRWRLETTRLQVRYRLKPGTYPLEVGFAGGAAWVALVDSGELLRIDVQGGSTSRIKVGNAPGGPPTPGFGSVWVSTADDTLWRIRTVTRKPIAIVRVGANPFGVAVGSGSVWVANHESGTVSRVDPATNTVVATIETGYFPQWLAADDRYVWVGLASTRWRLGD
ncbi:MAG: BTAD domain-containing putative transcriptional regulator, partial [Gaiella sp.]